MNRITHPLEEHPLNMYPRNDLAIWCIILQAFPNYCSSRRDIYWEMYDQMIDQIAFMIREYDTDEEELDEEGTEKDPHSTAH